MFQIHPLQSDPFSHLYGLSDEALARYGAEAMTADAKPGYPCRVTLKDAEIGERVILLNYEHQPAPTPYRSSHAIFIVDGAEPYVPEPDVIPPMISVRLMSVRAFNAEHEIIHAVVTEGTKLAPLLGEFFDDPQTDYIHLHYASRGCFAASVTRM